MIYIFTAMYCEAHVFIEYFGLKKVQQDTRFQQFYNEAADILLTVSGTGEIAAAAAVSSVCTQHKPGQRDFLLNAGICGGTDGMEGIFLANKLTEQATGKTFYPDLLYRHGFREAEIVTGMKVWDGSGEDAAVAVPRLYDMEAAAVYQAGAYFFGPHQMMFVKIISDHGSREVTAQQVQQLFAAHRDVILEFLRLLVRVPEAARLGEKHGSFREEELAADLCRDMHATKAMGDSLRQLVHYLALAGADYKTVISGMYGENILPCKDKREGKRCFAELKKRLL